MKRSLSIIALFAVVLAVAGCGGTKTVELERLAANDVQPPESYLNPPKDGEFLYGVATSTSLDLQLAVDKATVLGRDKISKKIGVELKSIETLFQDETGFLDDAELNAAFNSGVRGVAEHVLVGSSEKDKHVVREGEVWRAFVIMELPVKNIQQGVVEMIHEDESLNAMFGSTRAFKEIGGE